VTDTPISISATMLVPGRARGPVFALQSPLSFWGGFDAATGRIIDARHPQVGESLAGHVVVTEAGKGSSSGSSVLAEAIRLGTGPAGIVLLSRDAIVTVGAIVAAELYGKHCPVVLAEPENWRQIIFARLLDIVADRDRTSIVIGAPAAD
jgi:predicted aconitase with swiveling domain